MILLSMTNTWGTDIRNTWGINLCNTWGSNIWATNTSNIYVITIYVAILLCACTLVLLVPLSLKVNSREHEYAVSLGWIFQISSEAPQHPTWLRFSLFGCSWTREIRWPARWELSQLSQSGKVWMGRLIQDGETFSAVAARLKGAFFSLMRLASQRVDISLDASDAMVNALLGVIFTHWTLRGVRVRVNYLGENWLVGYFRLRLWVLIWVGLKFFLSRPVLKLGRAVLRSLELW